MPQFTVASCAECPGVVPIPIPGGDNIAQCTVLKREVTWPNIDEDCPFLNGGKTAVTRRIVNRPR